MPLETTIVPREPYSLALSARMKSDATRVLRDGVLTLVFEADAKPTLARVRQRPDRSLDVSIEGGAAPLAKLITPIAREKAFIPNHWDGLYEPFFAGMPYEWSNPELEAYLANEGIALFPPCQYMEKWQLDSSGVSIVPNNEVKQRLGFSECR